MMPMRLIVWRSSLRACLALAFTINLGAGYWQDPADAMAAQQRGDWTGAETIWRQLTAAAPKDYRYWTSLGACLAHQNRYADAIADYRKALALSPHDPQTNFNLGLAYFKTGNLDRAIPPLQAAERSLPQAANQIQLLLGMSFYGRGQLALAAPHLEAASKADQGNSELQLVLARAYLQAHDFSKAQGQFAQMLTTDPDSGQVHLLLGEALDGMGKQDAAAEEYRIAAQGKNIPDAHFSLGYTLWRDKNYGGAAEEFRKELAGNPKNHGALAYLGDVMLKSGETSEAEQKLRESVALKDNLWITHYDLGILAEKQQKYGLAIAEFQHANVTDSQRPEVHYHLAQSYKAVGKTAEAQRELRTVRSIHAGQTDDLVLKITGDASAK